ncbi:MBL fold metallo-hydrolase, partial [bacterium]|nr:MBL fold metallo-hydrolase [bacterium]
MFVLVDPGSNEEILRNQLFKEGLTTDAVGRIFLTHYHLDHLLNIRLFPHADVLDGNMIYTGDAMNPYTGYIPGTTIQVVSTPGHTPEHASLVFRNELGVIAVAGDVIWWENGAKQDTSRLAILSKKDPYATDITALQKSREALLSIADYIIPGHGSMFKVQK